MISACLVFDGDEAALSACVSSLAATSAGWVREILVLSHDSDRARNAVESPQRAQPSICFLTANRPLSFPASLNIAAKTATGDFLLFLAPTTCFRSGWIDPFIEALRDQPQSGFTSAVQRDVRTNRVTHMGMMLDGRGGVRPFGYGMPFLPFNGRRDWPAVGMNCTAVRRDLFLSVAGFDESMGCFAGADCCLRLGLQGYPHLVTYESTVWQRGPSSCVECRHDAPESNHFMHRWRSLLLSPQRRGDRRMAAIYRLLGSSPPDGGKQTLKGFIADLFQL